MHEQHERRRYARMDISCRLSYKYPNASQEFRGDCANIGGAGIIFTGEAAIDPGLAIELNIPPDNPLKLSLRAFAEVLGCSRLASGNYEISCEIKGIR